MIRGVVLVLATVLLCAAVVTGSLIFAYGALLELFFGLLIAWLLEQGDHIEEDIKNDYPDYYEDDDKE